MGIKYVKDFEFPAAAGFRDSAMPAKAGMSSKGMPSRAKPNAPARGAARMESKPKMGKGQGYAMGGKVPGREMDRLPAKKAPGRTMDLAPSKPFKGEYQGYAKGGKIAKYAKGGRVQKFANGGAPYVPNPNVANPNIRRVPGIGPQYRGAYQTPIEMQELQRIAQYMEMSPHKFEQFANKIIAAGKDAPAAIEAAAKAAGRSGMIKGGVGGAAIGALGTAFGPQIMDYLRSIGDRKKPTVTVEEIDQPQGRARGGRITKHMAPKAGKMGDMPKMMRRGRK